MSPSELWAWLTEPGSGRLDATVLLALVLFVWATLLQSIHLS